MTSDMESFRRMFPPPEQWWKPSPLSKTRSLYCRGCKGAWECRGVSNSGATVSWVHRPGAQLFYVPVRVDEVKTREQLANACKAITHERLASVRV